MKKPPQRQLDPGVLAILHRAGSAWNVLVVRTTGTPTALVWREFPASQANRINSWLDEYNASEVLCVLPACAVICRTCPLPDAPLEHLAPALKLQAEAHLFGIAPPHRLGMAVLESAPGETTRSGIILAWPESASIELPEFDRPVRFVADVASLAALLDGQRPTQPLVWLDRNSGTMALALSHASGAAFRGVREDASDAQSWKTGVGRVIAETGLSAGHTGAFIESVVRSVHERMDAIPSGSACLMIPQVVRDIAASRLANVPGDDGWWSQYGIAAGAAIARTGALAPLTQLQQTAPVETPSLLTRVSGVLSDVRTARVVVIGCLLAILFGPLMMSGIRLAILNWRHSDIAERLAAVNATRDRLVVYRELERNTWSMTKILSDIAVNTPEAIELDSIRVANQSRNFMVQGRALPNPKQNLSAVEVVELMQAQLRDSGIFHDFAINWGGADAHGHYTFTLSAKLLRPFRRHNYPDELDYATYTVVDRRDGRGPGVPRPEATQPADTTETRLVSGATTAPPISQPPAATERTTPPPAPASDDSAPVRAPRTDLTPSAFGGDRPDGIDGGRPGVRTAPSADIPDPITREAVASWSVPEAREALRKWGEARNAARNRGDEELEQRLRDEFQMIMERLRGAG